MTSRETHSPAPHRTLRAVAALLLLIALLCPAPGTAEGVQTGTLVGRVVDPADLPLPGVEVRLEGPQTRRSGTTDDDGRFRFPLLEVGGYRVTADLLGLTAVEGDARVFIGKTTEIRLQLGEAVVPAPEQDPGDGVEPAEGDGLPTAREQIQVLALAPLIDRFETRVGASVGREFLETLPVQRFYQSVALLLPGVAGGEDGNPNTSGALRSTNLYLVDGVDTTDPTTGLFGLNLAYDGVEDVDVTTAAPTVDYGRTSGAVINVVTQSGQNAFRGSARWLLTNQDWNDDYRSDAPVVAQEVRAANSGPDDVDNTFSTTLSGPLAPDRLWFFGMFEDGEESLLRPTLEGTRWNEALGISSASLKLDLDLGPHTLSAQHNADDAAFGTFSVFDREPGENRAPSRPNRLSQELLLPFAGDIFALEERAQDGSFTKLEWSTVVGQDLAFTARVADQDRRLDRRPLNRRGGASAPHAVPTSFSLVPGPDGEPELQENDFALFNGITDLGEESRDRRQANVAGSWFTRAAGADHEIRFGVDYQETDSDRLLNVGGRPGVDRATGRDIAGQIFLDGDVRPPCVENLDCRPFDTRTGEFQPLVLLNFYSRPRRATRQTTLALYASDAVAFGRWLVSAGLRYERVDGEDQGGRPLVEDGSLSPRIAVKYDPVGDGQTLLSATWSRFVEPFPQRLLDNFGRAEPFSGYTEYVWGGLNEDAAEFCAAQDPNDPTGPCWLPAEVVDFAPIMVAPPNLNLDRSAVEEWVVGFERQLTANTALRLAWVDRNWVDLWDDRLTVDLQNPAGPQLVAVLENLPEAERSYRGIQLLVQKRYAERWQLLAAYTWSETEGNLFQAVGRSSFADFDDVTDLNRTNRLGLAPYDRTHQAKVFANYRQPLGWGDLSFGTSIRFEEGTPYQAEQAEDLGVLFATPRGSLQLEDVFQLDLSLQLDVPLVRGMELEAKLEAFNVTNGRAQVGVETDLGTGRFGQPRTLEDLQEPRAYRLLFGFQF